MPCNSDTRPVTDRSLFSCITLCLRWTWQSLYTRMISSRPHALKKRGHGSVYFLVTHANSDNVTLLQKETKPIGNDSEAQKAASAEKPAGLHC